jgi:phosphotransferase system IIB component
MSGVSSKTHTQQQLNHYSDQNNPNNEQYQAVLNNRSDQFNSNNDKYWDSRGEEKPGK